MQGRIIKDHEGWWIQYYTVDEKTAMAYITETALHPDDVKQIEEWSKVFDNIEARILANPEVEVEFKIVKEKVANVGDSEDQEEYFNTYAKLVILEKEQQKQFITEIMNEDAKDGLYDTVNDTVNEVDKLAANLANPNADKTDNWKEGYLYAKETLYTKEQMKLAFEYGNNYHKGSIADAQQYTFEKLIQSLKQSK